MRPRLRLECHSVLSPHGPGTPGVQRSSLHVHLTVGGHPDEYLGMAEVTRVRSSWAGDVRALLEAQGPAEAAFARAAYDDRGDPTPALATTVRDPRSDLLLVHEVAVRGGAVDHPDLAALVFAAAVDSLGAGAGAALCRPDSTTLPGRVLQQATDQLALASLPGGVRVADLGRSWVPNF